MIQSAFKLNNLGNTVFFASFAHIHTASFNIISIFNIARLHLKSVNSVDGMVFQFVWFGFVLCPCSHISLLCKSIPSLFFFFILLFLYSVVCSVWSSCILGTNYMPYLVCHFHSALGIIILSFPLTRHTGGVKWAKWAKCASNAHLPHQKYKIAIQFQFVRKLYGMHLPVRQLCGLNLWRCCHKIMLI